MTHIITLSHGQGHYHDGPASTCGNSTACLATKQEACMLPPPSSSNIPMEESLLSFRNMLIEAETLKTMINMTELSH